MTDTTDQLIYIEELDDSTTDPDEELVTLEYRAHFGDGSILVVASKFKQIDLPANAPPEEVISEGKGERISWKVVEGGPGAEVLRLEEKFTSNRMALRIRNLLEELPQG